MICILAALSLAGLPLAAASSSPTAPRAFASGPDTLADTTVVERWTLDNGLRVTTRDIPDAGGVAMTVGYPFGSDQDPEGREGLAQLLSQLVFTAPAAEFPERTAQELESQRPYGWSFSVTRHSTLFTEVASIDQFPGVLREFAARMRGVKVTPEALRATIRDVRQERTAQALGRPESSLEFLVREVALERADGEIARRAAAKGLERISVREVEEHLKRRVVPSNATLSLAGHLEGVDVHRLVQNLFGDIPAGTPQSAAPPRILKPGTRVAPRAGLPQPVGAVGLIAPALDDSLHPSFLLSTLLIGNHLSNAWQPPGVEWTSRYTYSFLDEPDLVRFYPLVASDQARPEALSEAMLEALDSMRSMVVNRPIVRQVCTPILWLMGGPMAPEVRARVTRDPQALHTLARSMAACSMWRGEEFWSRYRERLQQPSVGDLAKWVDYYRSPEHHVRLLLVPGK
ncbi:MAG TPA: insulinase family protein [Candidatus Eisenbacteria bacterium]